MNYILYAVPFFFVLIALELFLDRWRGVHTYRFSDAVNSLSAGVLSTTVGLLTKAVGLLTYTLVWQYLGVFELSASSLWVWLFAFVFYDFCYYWNHRLGHERNVLWAAHSVHHQSEDYNLSTALRQTSTGFIFGWIFYVPMAVLGVPPLVFLSVAALNLLYQFWVHTRHIPKLGWFEWFFITPSNHRVHHAQNVVYMDRNYGGVFILWDRLFGTFQEELDEEPVVFGVTTPLASWNPLWANAQFYLALWRDAMRCGRSRGGTSCASGLCAPAGDPLMLPRNTRSKSRISVSSSNSTCRSTWRKNSMPGRNSACMCWAALCCWAWAIP